MKKRKVISTKQLPVRLPITSIALHVFLWHYFKLPTWVLAVYITLAVILLSAIIGLRIREEKTEINL